MVILKHAFKDKYLEKFSAGISDEIVVYARNAATGVLAIWEVVRTSFYERDLGGFVETIQNGLNNDDLLSYMKLPSSERFLNLFKEQRYEILISKFFEYYWSRLPILFKCNRVIHHGRKRRLTKKEIEITSKASFYTFAEAYPNAVNTDTILSDYKKMNKLTKWYARSGHRDDEVYNADWLLASLMELYPETTADDNVGNITTHVIESCFPMFWDTFQDRYRKSLYCYANLGWFVGDLDTEELCEKNKMSG